MGSGLALLLARLLDLCVLGAAVLDLAARPTVEPVGAHLIWAGLGVRFSVDFWLALEFRARARARAQMKVRVNAQIPRLGLGLGC